MTKKNIKAKDSKAKKIGEWFGENKFTVAFGVVIIAFLAGMIWLSNLKKIDLSNVDTSKEIAASEQSGNIAEHVYAKNNAKVTLIEYGDYQCPGCKSVSSRINAIAKEYKDSVKVIFRNFPLVSIHPNALAAASVVEAAGLQGKYWEMHDLMYEKQDEWTSSTASERMEYFTEYAKELGLNIDQLKKDMDSSAVKSKISYDQAIGGQIGVSSTPSFFLNSKEVSSDVWGDDAKLKEALNSAIKSAK